MTFDLADFYHNEGRIIGVDTLELDLIATGDILEALRPSFESGGYHDDAPGHGSYSHDLARLAVAALRYGGRLPRALHRVLLFHPETFDGQHLLAGRILQRGDTRSNSLPVKVNGACTAGANTAAELRSVQPGDRATPTATAWPDRHRGYAGRR
jgi:hypothetical protein